MEKRQPLFYLIFSLLWFCNSFSQNTQIGTSADVSILELKKEFLKNIQGTWMLNESDSTSKSNHDEILIISEKEIAFYTRKKDSQIMELISKEKITPKDKVLGKNYLNLTFANNDIWNVTLKSNEILHFINTGKIMKNGYESKIACGNMEKTYKRIK